MFPRDDQRKLRDRLKETSSPFEFYKLISLQGT